MKVGILFDLDGTLLDTLGDLHAATNHILQQYGCPTRTLAEIRRFVGNGARRQIEQALPGKENDPPLDQVLADYQKYYTQICTNGNTRPYPGVPEALARIQTKYPVAVVSNKPDRAVSALCADWFPGVYALGVREGCPRKPAPDMVRKAMAQMGVDACVYVGDSEVDVLTAQNAQLPCLIVLWGFRDREELEAAGGKHFCEKVEDMPAMIDAIITNEL